MLGPEGALVAPRMTTAQDLQASGSGVVIGAKSAEIAARLGPAWQPWSGSLGNPAVAMARAALAKDPKTFDPPKPLYLRPADAAPSKDPPPVILP